MPQQWAIATVGVRCRPEPRSGSRAAELAYALKRSDPFFCFEVSERAFRMLQLQRSQYPASRDSFKSIATRLGSIPLTKRMNRSALKTANQTAFPACRRLQRPMAHSVWLNVSEPGSYHTAV